MVSKNGKTNINMLVSKLYKYARNILALKKTDVFLVSFPKSGNTWVRFYLCNLINQIPEYHFTDDDIGFKMLDDTMLELGSGSLHQKWPFKGFPRIIKTHLPYKMVLGKRKSILILRDPRDVMVSYYKFETTKTQPRFTGSFENFIRHPKFGVESWCKHSLSWLKIAKSVIRYEDLKTDDVNIFRKLNEFLGVKITESEFEKAIELSRFENIKKVEAVKGAAIPSKFGADFKFARSGNTGQWMEMFSDADIEYVNDVLAAYNIDLYK
jgi:hypothetical protein